MKQTKYHLVILLFFAVFYSSYGQNKEPYALKKNQFRVGLGAGNLQTLDLQVSPKTYKGVRTNLQLEYLRIKEKGIFSSNLNVSLANLTPTSGPALNFYLKETDIQGAETNESKMLELSQMGFQLEVGYLHKLNTLTSTRTAFYLGGSLEENMIFVPSFLHIGVINCGSLNAKTRFDYRLKNGKSLIFQLSLPLVSVVTRFPYHGAPAIPGKSGVGAFFTGNNKIETINHFQNVRFSVKYPWLVTKRMTFDIGYEASWLHYSKPQHVTQAVSQLSLSLTF